VKPRLYYLDEMRGNGLQLVPALKATMGLHDIIKQICHHFFFLYQPCDVKARWAIELLAHPPHPS